MEKLKVSLRDSVGKNKVDKLRVENLVPGVIYGNNKGSRNISVVEKDLVKIVEEAGTSNIIDIDLDGQPCKVLFKEIQNHPFKNKIVHFDMFEINMSEKIRISIPVVLENRDEIRVQPSILFQSLDEVEIEVLPGDLPSEAVFDVQNMQIGDVITVADLDVSKNDKIEVLTEADTTVASLSEPKSEEEIDEELSADTSASAEVPTVGETKEKEEE
ncbi:50S ribosomal protein L25 [Peptoniphilus sp. GNH]|nr:50S ribosomal protein L25 [Peptoniphilus sp. GNH]